MSPKPIATDIELLEHQWRDKLKQSLVIGRALVNERDPFKRGELLKQLEKLENAVKSANDWSLLPEVRDRERRILELEEKLTRLERELWLARCGIKE